MSPAAPTQELAPDRTAPSAVRRRPLLIVISAPSGGGKTTLCEQLLAADPGITRAVTCTTRPPRAGEVNGRDYHFLDPGEFRRRVEAGEFLEHATVYGNSYGTLQSEVLSRFDSGRDVLLNIDVQGAASVQARAATDPRLGPALVSVFLTPATLAVLEQRLRKRASDSEEVIQRRLMSARQEAARWAEFQYLIPSESIASDLRRMQVILEAERMRRHRSDPPDLG